MNHPRKYPRPWNLCDRGPAVPCRYSTGSNGKIPHLRKPDFIKETVMDSHSSLKIIVKLDFVQLIGFCHPSVANFKCCVSFEKCYFKGKKIATSKG